MPRKPKKAEAAVVESPITAITLKIGRKEYSINGGVNKHGRFTLLTERIGGRTNHLYVNSENWTEVRDAIDKVNEQVLGLPLLDSPPKGG